jgi:hypothetical protein
MESNPEMRAKVLYRFKSEEEIMNRRAQSALEFLMTYGWAILIILVAIAALTYFGVLSPSRLLPSRCTFSPEVSCEEFKITSPSTVAFKFRNNLGFAADFTATTNSTEGFGTCIPAGQPFSVGAGKIQEATCDLAPGGIPSGEKIKVQVYMTYKKLGGSYDTPIQGEIYTTST